MRKLSFDKAIESALKHAMERDTSIFIMGEDVHSFRVNLFTQFGKERVIKTPISEGAFVGAAVTAAMAGLRPIVEVMLVDFIAVAMDAIINHSAKTYAFSGEKWNVPMVIRTTCGGGYGDGGQHEQSLWGWLAHIPGISVVVPSNPADAGCLMLSAIESDHPVIFLEHKLLADYMLEYMGRGGRSGLSFDVPEAGREGEIPKKWVPLPFGKANVLREGTDITLISLGISVHRCLEAAELLKENNISTEVLDLRWVSPLDVEAIIKSVTKTKRIIVVDEDYTQFGLSGEVCALLSERNVDFTYGRVCTDTTIPFNRKKEDETLPNVQRIIKMAKMLIK
jgi:pyruvate/2-oxoglutarate/acetoin dehydrogenase E1 component